MAWFPFDEGQSKGYQYVPRDEQYTIGEKNTDNSWFWKWVFTYLFSTVYCITNHFLRNLSLSLMLYRNYTRAMDWFVACYRLCQYYDSKVVYTFEVVRFWTAHNYCLNSNHFEFWYKHLRNVVSLFKVVFLPLDNLFHCTVHNQRLNFQENLDFSYVLVNFEAK